MAEYHGQRARELIEAKKNPEHFDNMDKLVLQIRKNFRVRHFYFIWNAVLPRIILKGESAERVDQSLDNEDKEAEEIELEEQSFIKEETEEKEPSAGDDSASREGDRDYGSIKSLGFVEKVISKTFFCMKPRARIGVFFLLTLLQEVVGLISGISTIWLMMKTGFAVEGSLLLLVQEFDSNISN